MNIASEHTKDLVNHTLKQYLMTSDPCNTGDEQNCGNKSSVEHQTIKIRIIQEVQKIKTTRPVESDIIIYLSAKYHTVFKTHQVYVVN